jgi:cupin 2 domain-containing protein
MSRNLFDPPALPLAGELLESLVSLPNVRIERIVSYGHASTTGFWYDQEEAEWVAVLAGRARIRLQDPEETLELSAGDHLWIAAHRRHRVEWTAPDRATIWLAVFIGGVAG